MAGQSAAKTRQVSPATGIFRLAVIKMLAIHHPLAVYFVRNGNVRGRRREAAFSPGIRAGHRHRRFVPPHQIDTAPTTEDVVSGRLLRDPRPTSVEPKDPTLRKWGRAAGGRQTRPALRGYPRAVRGDGAGDPGAGGWNVGHDRASAAVSPLARSTSATSGFRLDAGTRPSDRSSIFSAVSTEHVASPRSSWLMCPLLLSPRRFANCSWESPRSFRSCAIAFDISERSYNPNAASSGIVRISGNDTPGREFVCCER